MNRSKQAGMAIRTVVALLVGLTLASVHLAEAQQPKKVPRIGYLVAGSSSSEAPRIKAFREGLRQLGYVEGQNIIIEYRYGDGRPTRLPDLSADLVRLEVNVIVTGARRFALQRTPAARYPLSWPSVSIPWRAAM